MTWKQWASTTIRHLKHGNTDGMRDSGYQLYTGTWRRVGHLYNYGTLIYEYDWDLLIVLDACRYDLFYGLVNEYNFLSDKRINSVGSATEEWMAKNFTARYHSEMADTVYISGNPHSAEEGSRSFRHIEDVWSHSWDDDVRTTLAEDVTEYAIAAGRQMNPERTIVHYMQPHHPFVSSPELNEGIGFDQGAEYKHIWEKLRRGDVSHETVWEGYLENLRYVLDSVNTLLKNFDANSVVITSDHGNAMGEYGIYGHPMYVPLSVLKRVPFCRTTATDTGSVTPSVELAGKSVDEDVSERLGDLGYA